MPTRESRMRRIEERQARQYGIATSSNTFVRRLQRDAERVGILMEGDSWFDYPPKYIFGFKPRNVASILQRHIKQMNGFANILSLAMNGDTADEMTEQPGLKDSRAIFERAGEHIDFVLISAGGNDIVGQDMRALLNQYQPSFNAEDCINQAFDNKLAKIKRRYENILNYVKLKGLNTQFITHTYCYLEPVPKGVNLFNRNFGKGWIYPYLSEKNIPRDLHKPIVVFMLNRFHAMLKSLVNSGDFPFFHILDIRSGLLSSDHNEADWSDEMHPSELGFEKIANVFLEKMHELDGRVRLTP